MENSAMTASGTEEKAMLEKHAPQAAPYPWKRHFLVLCPLLVVALAVGAAHGYWGENVRLWHEGLRASHPTVTRAMRIITNWGAVVVFSIYLPLLVCALSRGDRRTLLFFLRAALGWLLFAFLATQAIKAGLGMPRPGNPLPPQPFHYIHAYASFPSGHTVTIIMAALPLALWFENRRRQVALALVILAVSYSRLWLGMHHPVDILGGIVLGSLGVRLLFPREYPRR